MDLFRAQAPNYRPHCSACEPGGARRLRRVARHRLRLADARLEAEEAETMRAAKARRERESSAFRARVRRHTAWILEATFHVAEVGRAMGAVAEILREAVLMPHALRDLEGDGRDQLGLG